MLGPQYERALLGERCWLRHDDGERVELPVDLWLGHHGADHSFDETVVSLCTGPTIDLGCGPGRLVAQLIRRGLPALGIDQSATAVRIANQRGAPALRGDVFSALPGEGGWGTVLLVDGNIGLAGDPVRVLARAARLLAPGGQCLVEFDPATSGAKQRRVRLESDSGMGRWFDWASVGLDSASELTERAGLTLTHTHRVGARWVAQVSKPR